MPHTITINVSNGVYRQLQRASLLFRQPAESIISDSLNHTLPPLLEDIPEKYQSDVFPLLSMTKQELLEEAGKTFPEGKWRIYDSLLERKKTGGLPPDEERSLNLLCREADVFTLRRSYAAVLLKQNVHALRLEAGWHPPGF